MQFSFSKSQTPPVHIGQASFYVIACLFVIFVNGAVPFFGIPTLGQAVWTTGFSQSFANDSILSIHAHNIGAPHPAAMAFGLAGAWLAGVFIRLGLHAADAYALMVACWLTLAFWGAYRLSRALEVAPALSVIAALGWGTMPMVWNHAGYSMLSTGIALLPLYMWTALRFLDAPLLGHYGRAISYLMACILAIFMDGYSFMMFATGASILAVAWYWRKRASWLHLGIHGLCFLTAYVLFALYIGRGQYAAADLNFFRGWGADLGFFLIPSAGVHWFADLAGWSRPRSMREYFGDESVWITTFCLPLLVFAAVFFLLGKGRYKYPLMLILLFGFYMAMGPSLKFNSLKPATETSLSMDAKYAIAPTGSGFISQHVPGFKNMRASYRWAALGVFGAWALLVAALSRTQRKEVSVAAALSLVLVVAANLPNLPQRWELQKSYRSQFMQIDQDLLLSLGQQLHPGDKVAFMPWRNDFLVNYLASKLDVVAYNIGGDKNFEDARRFWPEILKTMPLGGIPDDFSQRIVSLLRSGDADAVVIPYVDMLWAAHRWPYPAEGREALRPKLLELSASPLVSVAEETSYAVIRLKPPSVLPSTRQE
ncbi:hypothetical protein HS961_02860 [Comamonas piscis]|uniref:Glycosyltransferase family 39 protein n=1 Tax=Comamonas piscis TaxID=1562974 RepID=A0A7G5ECY3_9BURK|nr:hypothetical protein [Comamonas piscis]QMV71858.1 hypothetical protein HS961_02860 [Comamonas piscis]WSO34591.1 hypothetical protein VUJ63_02875 [Comamonas piscis]